MNKPKLTPRQLVAKMKTEKGITFNYISEENAIKFLKEKNNYFRLAAYRKNYDKKLLGPEQGKYMNLDFACLVDLSIIDMRLRRIVFQMCLDIEHDLKIKLLNDITIDENEDGYSIVDDFVNRYDDLKDEIYKKRYSTYVGDLINKFFSFDVHLNANNKVIYDEFDVNCPLWAFVEIISFGTFIKLYEFYYDTKAPLQSSVLNPIKSLRNACAHNNCIINNLRRGNTKPTSKVSQFVAKVSNISKDERKRHLSSQPMFEFCTLLMVYNDIVSENVKSHRYTELCELVNERIVRHSIYYENQQLLKSSYKFMKKIVDFLQ